MAQDKSSNRSASKDLAYMLIEGGQKSVAELSDAATSMLRPFGKLERRRVAEFSGLEIELEQHKRLRDARLQAEARDLLAGFFAEGEFLSVARNQFPEAWVKANTAVYGEGPSRQEILNDLRLSHGISFEELLARAFQRIAKELDHHEKRIAALERRRREFLEDYEALRAIGARTMSEVEP